MGMSKLNIFVTSRGDPCRMSNRTWFVTIYTCDGEVLEWCGRRYLVIPARCGHLEVEVPPGCYYISAVWGFRILGRVFRGNHFTHSAVVQACCEQTHCVTLYNPDAHQCGVIFTLALRDLARQDILAEDRVEEAEAVLQPILDVLAEGAPRGFEVGHLDEIRERVEEEQKREQKEEGGRKKKD